VSIANSGGLRVRPGGEKASQDKRPGGDITSDNIRQPTSWKKKAGDGRGEARLEEVRELRIGREWEEWNTRLRVYETAPGSSELHLDCFASFSLYIYLLE
jgi:hypothetical protein